MNHNDLAPDRNEPLVAALARIIAGRETLAEGGSFLRPDQGFDDWAADIAQAALEEEGWVVTDSDFNLPGGELYLGEAGDDCWCLAINVDEERWVR